MKVGNSMTPGPALAALSLPPSATPDEVKRAYRSLLRQLHPDTAGGGNGGEELTKVVHAYRKLERSGYLDESVAVPDEVVPPRNGRLLDVRA